MTSEPAACVVICPIRYDDGARAEDQRLWVDLRQQFANSPSQLLGFVSVSRASYWVDQFNPVPAQPVSDRVERAS